jgi:hypothetical protein
MGTWATWPATGPRPPAKSRLRAGLALLLAVFLIGSVLGYRWWTTWQIHLEFVEDHHNLPLAFSPDGATLATSWFAGLRFLDVARGRLGACWACPYPVNNHLGVDGIPRRRWSTRNGTARHGCDQEPMPGTNRMGILAGPVPRRSEDCQPGLGLADPAPRRRPRTGRQLRSRIGPIIGSVLATLRRRR